MIRNEIRDIISLAEDLEAEDMRAVLATVIAANGSTYRPLGSMMLGGASSDVIAGGVSGGCLEEYILRRGHSLSDRQPATLLRFVDDPRQAQGDAPLLGCGGSIEVLVERFTSDHLAFLYAFAAAQDADVASAATCVIDSSIPSHITVRRSLWTAGDRSNLKPELESLLGQALYSECSAQGLVGLHQRALVQYIRPVVRLIIFGAGSDARPLCTLGRSLGWNVVVADRRARLATRSRFPDADKLVVGDWSSAIRSLTFTPQTAVVLLTHSLTDDAAILPHLSEQPAAYIGVLGPKHRLRWLLEKVNANLPESFTSQIRGPIGLNLGDRSPSGIAVSIAAEILAELNGRTPTPLSKSSGERLSPSPSRVAAPHIH